MQFVNLLLIHLAALMQEFLLVFAQLELGNLVFLLDVKISLGNRLV